MRKKILLVSLIIISFHLTARAQTLPTLKPIGEKHLSEKISPAEKKGKWGYANSKGRFLVKAVFDEADDFQYALLSQADTVLLAFVKINDKWGILNRDGTLLVEPKYDEIQEFKQGVAIFKESDGYGFLSYSGEVLASQLQELDDFDSQGRAWYKSEDQWGVLSKDGSSILRNIYSCKATETIGKGLLKTRRNNKYGVISTATYSVIKDPDCDSLVAINNNSAILYKENGLYGFMSNRGETISSPQYEKILLKDGFIVVRKDGKYGKLNNEGEVIIPPCAKTNQFDNYSGIIQYWNKNFITSPGVGAWVNPAMLYYNNKSYDVESFDYCLFKKESKWNYIGETKGFPFWMKRNVHEALGERAFLDYWKTHGGFYPYLSNSLTIARECEMSPGSDAEQGVSIGRDMKIQSSYWHGTVTSLSSLKYHDEFPCGSLLTSLFKSVSGDKIKKYDTEHGTDFLQKWDCISLVIPGSIVLDDGNLLICVDVFISTDYNRKHMQRTIACLNKKGAVQYSIKYDGVLYNPQNRISIYDRASLFVTEHGFIVSQVIEDQNYNSVRINDIYVKGKRITSIKNTNLIGVFDADNSTFLVCQNQDELEIYILASGAKDTKCINPSFDAQNEAFLGYTNGYLLSSDKKTGLLKHICSISDSKVSIPVMRFSKSKWDGEDIVAFSKNHWKEMDKAQWKYLPAKIDDAMHLHFDDVLFSILPPNEKGQTVYSVKYENDPVENTRYGLIRYDNDFFTLPVWEEAKWISDDAVSVKQGDNWHDLTLEDISCFANNPQGVYDQSLYPVGYYIFDDSNNWSSVIHDGYSIKQSHGGDLIPYEYHITGKYGFVDKNGVMIVPPIYDDYLTSDYSVDNLIAVYHEDEDTPVYNDKNYGRIKYGWGFINMKGELVVPCKYDYIRELINKRGVLFDSNNICLLKGVAEDGSRKIGGIDKTGKIVFPFKYESIYQAGDTYKLKDGGKEYLADKNGVIIQ